MQLKQVHNQDAHVTSDAEYLTGYKYTHKV